MAIDYIWDLFKESWITEKSRKMMIEIEDIQKSLAHKAFDASSEAHIKFLKKTEQKIDSLKKKLPEIEFHKKRK